MLDQKHNFWIPTHQYEYKGTICLSPTNKTITIMSMHINPSDLIKDIDSTLFGWSNTLVQVQENGRKKWLVNKPTDFT